MNNNLNIKKILGYSIMYIHSFFSIFVLYIILFSYNFKLLIFVLLFTLIIVSGWVLFGNCILTPLENYLLEKNIKYESGDERSVITYYLEKYTFFNKQQIYNFFIYLQIFVVFITLIKINYLYYKKKIIY